jgi:hypothetical protein
MIFEAYRSEKTPILTHCIGCMFQASRFSIGNLTIHHIQAYTNTYIIRAFPKLCPLIIFCSICLKKIFCITTICSAQISSFLYCCHLKLIQQTVNSVKDITTAFGQAYQRGTSSDCKKLSTIPLKADELLVQDGEGH